MVTHSEGGGSRWPASESCEVLRVCAFKPGSVSLPASALCTGRPRGHCSVCGGCWGQCSGGAGTETSPYWEMLLAQSPKSQNSLPCGVLVGSKPREPLQEAGGGEHLAGGCRCVCGRLPGGTAITAAACDSAESTRVQSPLVTVGDSGQGVQVTSIIRKYLEM